MNLEEDMTPGHLTSVSSTVVRQDRLRQGFPLPLSGGNVVKGIFRLVVLFVIPRINMLLRSHWPQFVCGSICSEEDVVIHR